jgi:hypothetical protein
VTIRELPFVERPVHELLHFNAPRSAPDPDYAGYGWARMPEVWLDEQRVTDALVLAIHSADDSEPIAGDIEIEFELPGDRPVSVLATMFLEVWLPRLPRANAIVLALCNPHHAVLRRPAAAAAPVYLAMGDVESWLEHDHRIRLASQAGWQRLDA